MRQPTLKSEYQSHTPEELEKAQESILSRLLNAPPELTATEIMALGLPIGYVLANVSKLRRSPNSVWRQADVYRFFLTNRAWYPYLWLSHRKNQKRTYHRAKVLDYPRKVDWANSHAPLKQKAKQAAKILRDATGDTYNPRISSRMIQLLTNTTHSSARRIRSEMVRQGLVRQQGEFYFLLKNI